MKREVEIIKYDKNKGLQLSWEQDFRIAVRVEDGETVLSANEGGLISLAKHLLTLAQVEVPVGAHLHLDEYNSLEDGSMDLVIEKIDKE